MRAATPQERQNAYARARTELDGILVLPAATRASIERRIAGETRGVTPSGRARQRQPLRDAVQRRDGHRGHVLLRRRAE